VKLQAKNLSMSINLAQKIWGPLDRLAMGGLRELLKKYGFLVVLGHLQRLDGRWYITHAGLLDIAQRRRCAGILVQQVRASCDPTLGRWVFKAMVYKTPRSKGFVGYGDADPSNVSPLVRGAEMRVAETRAVNRALRKAYGIGLCSIEELGWLPKLSGSEISRRSGPHPSANNAQDNGQQNRQPRLRDRLCLLIRQHGLDANLVKAYAADYCGTATLREAGRDLVEAFINNLAEWAAKDRQGLLCHLNSYAKPEETGK
jgi:hypothetical protein